MAAVTLREISFAAAAGLIAFLVVLEIANKVGTKPADVCIFQTEYYKEPNHGLMTCPEHQARYREFCLYFNRKYAFLVEKGVKPLNCDAGVAEAGDYCKRKCRYPDGRGYYD